MINTNTTLITHLPEWSIIQVSGTDAPQFLNNLLTNNILSLSLNTSQLSGFCSPKGRLLASFWVSHEKTKTYQLWITSSLAQEFSKKLSMYRLRSNVSIDLMDEIKVYGITSPSPITTSAEVLIKLPNVIWQGTNYYRQLVAVKEDLPVSESNIWALLEVHSGIPRITNPTKDLFVPQMINFESIGGIDFKKGCYPGQEIVARSQYLGTIKRRLKIAHLNVIENQPLTIEPGMEIFSKNDPSQACGIVVLSSEDISNKRYDFQIEIKLSEVDSQLHLGNYPDLNQMIVLEDPPYPLITI
jgi:folate-binding protein YgfZ